MNPTDINPGQLRAINCLNRFNEQDCTALLEFLELETFPPNAVIIQEGAAGDCMYMILEGQTRVYTVKKGKEETLRTLGPGDSFGDIALFNHTPRLASVQATTAVKTLKLTEAALDKFAARHPGLHVVFLRTLTTYLTQAYAKFD